jgi:8-oxo-dGTP pyrophosphatase MutT (NUDIX family)
MSDKVLYQTKYLSLIERDGWYYFAQIPGSAGGVVMLLYREEDGKPILGRFEMCPAHHDAVPTLTAIAGGIEEGDTPLETAIKEAHEEAGYKLEASDFTDLGSCRLSTNQDTIVYLFAANVTGKERGNAPGDGTKGEEGAYCDWVSIEDAVLSKSAFMSTLLMRWYWKVFTLSGVTL